MKTVLVIGHTGFTGRHFLDYLYREKLHTQYRIVGCSRSEDAKPNPILSESYRCDLLQKDQLHELIRKEEPSYILNATGIYGSVGFEELLRQNVVAVSNLLMACKHSEALEKIVLIGSAAEYGIPVENPVQETHLEDPVNDYGLTKLYQTELARTAFRTASLPVVIARTFNLTGEGISPKLSVGNFTRQIEKAKDGETLRVGNLQSSRDFLPVEKAVEYYWTLLIDGKPGETYNVCSGEPTKIEDLLNSLIRKSGKNLKYETDPAFLKSNDVDVITGSTEKFRSLAGN